MSRLAVIVPALAGLLSLGAATPQPVPRALADVAPGWWEVSTSASGAGGRRLCLANVVQLAAIGHPGEHCSRTILRQGPRQAELDLSCTNGEFARAKFEVTTPRSVKLDTQGIHRGEPFQWRLYARRIGSCHGAAGQR